ncbi:hypothetical protein HQ586_04455 [Candidatus Bathyarchaeota archaeon]|nr:hypothetical protein [Candidatus Bathyarchaeota archaeon]
MEDLADTFIYNKDRMDENDYRSSSDILNGLNELGIRVEVSEENVKRPSRLSPPPAAGSPTWRPAE